MEHCIIWNGALYHLKYNALSPLLGCSNKGNTTQTTYTSSVTLSYSPCTPPHCCRNSDRSGSPVHSQSNNQYCQRSQWKGYVDSTNRLASVIANRLPPGRNSSKLGSSSSIHAIITNWSLNRRNSLSFINRSPTFLQVGHHDFSISTIPGLCSFRILCKPSWNFTQWTSFPKWPVTDIPIGTNRNCEDYNGAINRPLTICSCVKNTRNSISLTPSSQHQLCNRLPQ